MTNVSCNVYMQESENRIFIIGMLNLEIFIQKRSDKFFNSLEEFDSSIFLKFVAEELVKKCIEKGINEVNIFVEGPIQVNDFTDILSNNFINVNCIKDITPAGNNSNIRVLNKNSKLS